MYFRSDLALELAENTSLSGVNTTTRTFGDVSVSTTVVGTALASKSLGKPVGEYVTVEFPPLWRDASHLDITVEQVSRALRSLLPEGTCLVVGLGNGDITPDAVGPLTASRVLATRHISSELKESIGLTDLSSVAVVCPGVLGKTGVESAQVIRAVVDLVKPASVVVVDAFACRSVERLGCTVQITNGGISPGSGVGNSREELSKSTLGVPVVSVGIPTVVSAYTVVASLTDAQCEEQCREALGGEDMFVTPREIDLLVDRGAKLLATSINRALQPSFTASEIEGLL